MNTEMDLSEILLYLELMKRHKKKPSYTELNLMLYFLKDYYQVNAFYNKLIGLELKVPTNFYKVVLIHFIEDFTDCVNLKNILLAKRDKRKKNDLGTLYRHLIMLCKSKEQAIIINNEAKEYGIEVGESWVYRYDSMFQIKKDQEEWKKNKRSYELKFFTGIYEEFCEMKSQYFDSLSLIQLRQALQENETHKNDQTVTQTTVYNRSIFVKAYARRVAQGICQLCDKEAPFLDKQGMPYLEAHHIHYLSQGGSDTIDNVVALCPNCHRRIHQLELKEDTEKINEKALVNMNI
jgi:5-methylcytosine-specific restriction endonuclease McrA